MHDCDVFKHLHQRRKVGVLKEKCLNNVENMQNGMIWWGWDKAWHDEDQVPISDAYFDLQVCCTTLNVTTCGGVFCLSYRRLFVRCMRLRQSKYVGTMCSVMLWTKKVTHVQKLTKSTVPRELHAWEHHAHCHDRCRSWLELHAFAVFLVAS